MIPDKVKSFIFFTKYNLYKPDTIKFFHTLQKNQYLSVDELEELNWQKRRRLLKYAYAKVPYYRKKFQSVGLHPEDIVHPDDFQKVPLLKRNDLKENFNEMLSDEARPRQVRLSTTGGSTGEPVKVMFDKRVPLEALGWRMLGWWGIKPGLNSACCWREVRPKIIGQVINQLLWWPTLRIKLDASSMKSQDIEKFVKKFNRIRPALLHGYVGAVDYIASFIEQNRYSIVPPKAVSVTSSPITAVQRKRIEKAFNAPVYDQYGTCEIFWVSAQCGQKKASHMFYDARFIEFVGDNGNVVPMGELGDVVVTDLENYLFPLIRYVNGDKGRALRGGCPCGINLPLMDQVHGRQSDLVKLPDGSCISGEYLTTLFDDAPDVVKGFQVHQKKDYSIKVIYVPSSNPEGLAETLARVHRQLMIKTGSQVKITMEPVENIPHDEGKLRFVISDVD
jgi:phenylacetate-CoA ligase